MARPTLTYAQATKRRDTLFAAIEDLVYRSLATSDWAQNVLNDSTMAIAAPDGTALSAADRAALLADYAVLSQVASLLRNVNPTTGQALGVDVMYAVRKGIVPGQNAA